MRARNDRREREEIVSNGCAAPVSPIGDRYDRNEKLIAAIVLFSINFLSYFFLFIYIFRLWFEKNFISISARVLRVEEFVHCDKDIRKMSV